MTKDEFIKLRNDFPKNYTKKIKANNELFFNILKFNMNKNLSIAQLSYNYFFNIKEIPKCETCGNDVGFGGNKKFGYNKFCSKKCVGCANKDSKINIGHKAYNTISDKKIFSIEYKEIINIKERIQKAIDTYDVANIKYLLWKNDPFLLRAIYELSNANNFKEKLYQILNDIKQAPLCKVCGNKKQNFISFIKGYSGFCSQKCGSINTNRILNETNRKRNFIKYKNDIESNGLYGVLSDIDYYIKTGMFTIKHQICGNEFNIKHMSNRKSFCCPRCSSKSNLEQEISNFINNELNIDTINNTKPLIDHSQSGNKGNKEIDILIPEYNIGIEFDGIYWHSEVSGNKSRNYHLEKTELAKEQLNINLIHIFENEWINKQEIVKSVIRNKLHKIDNRIFARKCKIGVIKPTVKKKFLDNNHLQGNCKSSINLGLYHGGELISLMTFGKRKIAGGKVNNELLRFCNKINVSVIGGASKLFKYYIKNFWNEELIITYADKRYSDGGLYNHLGFTYSHDSKPNYWYIINDILIHRSNYMKHKLKDKLDVYDSNLTEWENMQLNGFDRIWDCGNKIYKYNKDFIN